MSDWHGDDDFDTDWVPQQPGDGVRVVGEDLIGPETFDAPRPVSRFALPGDPEPSWAPDEPVRPSPRDQSIELPHWTEPPTGQVPRVLGNDTSDADYETWAQATGSGPRFRTGGSDWSDGDWGEGELFKDNSVSTGALDDRYEPHEDPYAPPRRSRGRGRRGRRDEGEHDPSVAHAPGPGGLEGAPPPEHFDSYDQYDEGHGADGQPADTGTRVLTAAIVAAVALAAFAGGRGTTMILVTAIVGLSAFELYAAFQKVGYHPATAVGLLGCVAIVPIAYNKGEAAFPLVAILVVAFTFLWYLIEVVRARPTINVGLTLLPFMWVGFFGAFAGMMLFFDPAGLGMLQGVVICAVGCDVASYFGGRAFGRTPLLSRVSPNKTVEGFIAGAVVSVALGGVVGSMLSPWSVKGIGAGIVLGMIVAITAPIGDLIESSIKRDLGVKDLGTFLPGHGGFLDRFDGVLFALPLAWYWAEHLFFHL